MLCPQRIAVISVMYFSNVNQVVFWLSHTSQAPLSSLGSAHCPVKHDLVHYMRSWEVFDPLGGIEPMCISCCFGKTNGEIYGGISGIEKIYSGLR